MAVQAVFTSLDETGSVDAVSAVMQAQVYRGGVAHGERYGLSEMRECDVGAIRGDGAEGERVSVVMPDSMPRGLLWLAAYPYWQREELGRAFRSLC